MKRNIAIVTWWENWEREISLKSAKTIFNHLDKELNHVTIFNIPSEYWKFIEAKRNFDLVIPVIHGIWGENWEITRVCEEHNIPVFFTTTNSHELCIDKYLCTLYLKNKWITVPETSIIELNNATYNLPKNEKVFIKPVHWGSSLDSWICSSQEETTILLSKITTYDQALVQEYITGQEFTVSLVWDWDWIVDVYAISEIITWESFFDYEAKYNLKNTQEITPAKISWILEKTIKDISIDIYRHCKLTCLARIDFIYNKEKNILYFLEVNTIPWFTETSFFPQAIQHRWFSISAFLENMIEKICI